MEDKRKLPCPRSWLIVWDKFKLKLGPSLQLTDLKVKSFIPLLPAVVLSRFTVEDHTGCCQYCY